AMGQAVAGFAVSKKDVGAGFIADYSNCIVYWGTNATEATPRGIAWVRQAKKRRTIRSIVVDPRTTRIAEEADIHLKLRPGTDGALALGWINIIINEGLYDKDFVKNWTTGFEELAERAREYPPEKVAAITGLTAEEIVASARMYAANRPAVIVGGVATDQIGLNGTRVEQACAICAALTGNIDIRGGSMIPGVGPRNEKGMFIRGSNLELIDKLPEEQRKKQIGFDRFRLMTWPGYEATAELQEKYFKVPSPTMHRMGASPSLLWRAILTGRPYPITAMISWESNPLMWAGNTKVVYEAMKSPNLQLYVVNEYWMTTTALMADYVLPVASWMERSYIDTQEDFADFANVGEKPIEPLYERKEDYYFWRGLGRRLGQEKYWPWETFEEHIAYRVAPLGLTYEDAVKAGCLRTPAEEKKYLKNGFATPSGKFELSSSVLKKLGYDPLPYYEEPAESPVSTPEVAKDYPLILGTGGRFMPQYHSEFRHYGTGAREVNPDPLADVNTADAVRLGIRDGDRIYIETRRGRIKQKARVSDKIIPGVVNVQSSWWFPEMPAEEPSLHGLWEANANVLTIDEPDECDPLTGGWQARAMLCKVYKA
ncbi:MAG: molybdopterin-dependent oxidoreductase, partial [Chloroflexota bacterium]